MPAAFGQAQPPPMLPLLLLKPITDMGADHPARTPSFTLLSDAPNQQLMLWWHVKEIAGDLNKSILLDNALWNGAEFIHPGSVAQKIRGSGAVSELAFNIWGPEESATLHFSGIPHQLAVAVCVMTGNECRQAFNATISVITGKPTATNQLQFALAPKIYSDLPFTMEGFGKPAKLPTPDDKSWPALPPDYFASYRRPSLLIPTVEPQWFTVGKDDSTFWFTYSPDQGKTWQPKQVLQTDGEYPNLVMPAPKQLCLFYIDAHNSAAEWPDDVDNIHLAPQMWPRTRKLMERRSSDDGTTWSQPQVVVNDKLAVESRACVDATGRIWLVYVQSDPERYTQGRASLWLTSSGDGGQTWMPPARLTEGRYLDREPDIIAYDGKLLVAFTRGYQAVRTNIWVAEVDPKAVLAGQLVGMPLP